MFGHEPPGTNYNGMMLVPDQQQNNGPMRVIDTLSPEGRRGLKRALEEDKENLSHFSMFDHYMMYGVQPYESMYV